MSSVVPGTPKFHAYVSASPSASVAVASNATSSGASPVVGSAVAETSGGAVTAAPLPVNLNQFRFISEPVAVG